MRYPSSACADKKSLWHKNILKLELSQKLETNAKWIAFPAFISKLSWSCSHYSDPILMSSLLIKVVEGIEFKKIWLYMNEIYILSHDFKCSTLPDLVH